LAEKQLEKYEVVVVTITTARDGQEYESIIAAHRDLYFLALNHGWKIITVNRESDKEILQKGLETCFQAWDIEIIRCNEPVGKQLATAYIEGAKRATKLVFYTEGDKTNIVQFIEGACTYLKLYKTFTGIEPLVIVPSRETMSEYSVTRKWSEKLINLCQSFLIKAQGDWQLGPKLFVPDVILTHQKCITDYVEKRPGWEVATWLPIYLAKRFPGQVIPYPIPIRPMRNEDTKFFKDLHFRIFTQLPQAMRAIWDATR